MEYLPSHYRPHAKPLNRFTFRCISRLRRLVTIWGTGSSTEVTVGMSGAQVSGMKLDRAHEDLRYPFSVQGHRAIRQTGTYCDPHITSSIPVWGLIPWVVDEEIPHRAINILLDRVPYLHGTYSCYLTRRTMDRLHPMKGLDQWFPVEI